MSTTNLALPSRLEALRIELSAEIPCFPATAEIRAALQSLPLQEVLFSWVHWAQRFVRPSPRKINYYSGFWDEQALAQRSKIEAIAAQISSGADLTPLLSDRVKTHGYVPKNQSERTARGIDWQKMDFAINAYEVHHLHLDQSGTEELLFVKFDRETATFILLGTHKSFFNGDIEEAITRLRAESGEWELKGIEALERDLTPQNRTRAALYGISTIAPIGKKFVLSGLVSTAGTSMGTSLLSDRIEHTLADDDAKIDSSAIEELIPPEYISRLRGRNWRWAMHYCDLVLIEEESKMAFVRIQGPN